MNKKRFQAIMIFSFSLLMFFLIDWLTKFFFFDSENLYNVTHYWKFIGVRSFPHDNTTFFSFLKVDISFLALSIIDFLLTSIVIIFAIFSKNKFLSFSLGVLVAGMLGNSIDRLFTSGNYVRDIFFTPWLDRGTFNLADIFIIFASISTAISFFIIQLKNKN